MSTKSYDEVLFFVGYLRTMGLETSGIISTVFMHHGNRLSQLEVTNYVHEFNRRFPPQTRAWLARWALTMSLQFYRATERLVSADKRLVCGRGLTSNVSYRLHETYRDYIVHLRKVDPGTAGGPISLTEAESALGARCFRNFKPHHPEHLIWQWADYGPDSHTLSSLNGYAIQSLGASGSQKLVNFRSFLTATLPDGHPDQRNTKMPMYEHAVCYLRWLNKFNPVDELSAT